MTYANTINTTFQTVSCVICGNILTPFKCVHLLMCSRFFNFEIKFVNYGSSQALHKNEVFL